MLKRLLIVHGGVGNSIYISRFVERILKKLKLWISHRIDLLIQGLKWVEHQMIWTLVRWIDVDDFWLNSCPEGWEASNNCNTEINCQKNPKLA